MRPCGLQLARQRGLVLEAAPRAADVLFGGAGALEQAAVDLVGALLLLADIGFLGAAVEQRPADDAERLKVGRVAFEAVDVMAGAGAALEAELRPELGLGGANFLARRRQGRPSPRARAGSRRARCASASSSVAGMHCDRSGGIDTRVDRNAGQRAEGDRRGVEIFAAPRSPRARAACSRSSACCWSAMLIEPLETPSRRSPASCSWKVTLS